MGINQDHSHEQSDIAKRITGKQSISYVRDFVYGGIDGAITSFAIVTGVMGAQLSHKIILILGIANLFADGFSMAASNFAGVKAERDELARLVAIEKRHILESPEGEREEVRQLLSAQGLSGVSKEAAVDAITSKNSRWINFMLTNEYGVSIYSPEPRLAAFATFFAFITCGFVPIAPFIFTFDKPVYWSFACTAVVFFIIGAVKSRWSIRRWWACGLETLIIGSVAALVAFAIGLLSARIIN